MSERSVSTVTLRALEGEPLADLGVRSTVIATAEAIAERTGVHLVSVRAEPDRVVLTVEVDRIAAIGFAAELRKLTTNWHRAKFGGAPLWGQPPEGEAW